MKRISLLTQFSVLSFVLLAGIGLALGWGLTRYFEQQELERQKMVTASLLPPAVGPFLNADILKNGAHGKAYSDIEAAFSYLGGAGLVRIKIWNRDGMIVYSDRPELVGQKFPLSDEISQAFQGGQIAHISPLGKQENIEERGFGELMEVYTPLRLAGEEEIKGAFEGYYDIDDLRVMLNTTSAYLWASIAVGFIALYISLFAIVRGASDRLIRRTRENSVLLADTQRKAARLQTINDLAGSINQSTLDLGRVFETALRGIDRAVPHSGASISLLDDETGALVKRSVSPEGASLVAGLTTEEEQRLLGPACNFACANTKNWKDPLAASLLKKGIRSVVSVALMSGARRLGIVTVVNDKAEAFDDDDEAILKGVADQLAVAVENTRLVAETAETTALRETNRLKDEFVSMVSHELRTPLASIKGYSHTLLQEDGECWDGQTRQEFLSIIADESDKLSDLVENLLEMSRIDAGRLPINPEPVLLSRFCDRVVDRVAKHYPAIRFQCALPAPLPVVEADPRRLEQVLLNLLQNAAKYSGASEVAVRGGYDGGSEVIISVEDHGQGIPPEDLPHVFDKFYRVEKGTAGKATGTGLGLAICKALIEAQGGRIWVESKPGEGTRFYFTLPALVMPGEGDRARPVAGARA